MDCEAHYPLVCYGCSSWGDAIKTAKHTLVDQFITLPSEHQPTANLRFKPRKNADEREDFTQVFLCHAKLYVLACTYTISGLKKVAGYRLYATLKEFVLYRTSRRQDVICVTRYIFDNTVAGDEVRDMIALCFACIVEDVIDIEKMKELIADDSDFCFEVMSIMADRIISSRAANPYGCMKSLAHRWIRAEAQDDGLGRI